MVALVHSEALGCVRPSVLSRDRNSFCLCCSASPVPSPGSCDRSCPGPHSPCGTQSHPKKGVLVKLVKKGHLVLVKCLFPTPHPLHSLHTSSQPHYPKATATSASYLPTALCLHPIGHYRPPANQVCSGTSSY